MPMSMICGLLVLASGWTPLFDGKTLDGWRELNGTAKYSVENGEIVGRTVKGSPNSFLCTDKLYGDFELQLEVKTDKALNSGIQIRSMSVGGYQNGRVHGYQVEVDPSSRAWSGGLYDEGRRGWLRDLSLNTEGRKAFQNGRWNKYRIVAKGDHFQTWVNGVPTVDTHDSLTRFGFIGLQVHQADQDGLEVRFRNIRIKDNGLPWITPPKGVKWQLKTEADKANFVKERDGSPCPWAWTGESIVTGGTGDIMTKDTFGDCRAHIEFMTDENGKEGQENGNSGVYILRSYELQVLNSAPRAPADNECGGFYAIKAPDYAMAFPAGVWQTYDIEFHAPKWNGTQKAADAWTTIYHNGTMIHNHLVLPHETASGVKERPAERGFRLQDHGNKVQYRNIWIQRL